MAADDKPSMQSLRTLTTPPPPEASARLAEATKDSGEDESTATSTGESQGAIDDTVTHGSSAGPSKGETLLSTSKTWGPLELRRRIGQGRFGTVYVAWDPGLEREVALKILHEADQSAAVIQEARLLARVRHPNVVTVYGVDRNEDAVGLTTIHL